jgi:hypothetical protein
VRGCAAIIDPARISVPSAKHAEAIRRKRTTFTKNNMPRPFENQLESLIIPPGINQSRTECKAYDFSSTLQLH